MGKQSRAKRHSSGEEEVPGEPAHPAISPWTFLAILVGLSIISFVHFLPSLEGEFVNWDDKWNFVENANFGPLSDPDAVRWMWTNTRGHYMPLTWMTLAVDREMWGMDPWGWHLTSMHFHSANTLLFFMVLLLLLRAAFPAASPAHLVGASAAGALLFALHPQRVESVAWLTERRDLVSGNKGCCPA